METKPEASVDDIEPEDQSTVVAEPEPEPEPAPKPKAKAAPKPKLAPVPEPVWASAGDLGDATGLRDIMLPTLQRMVRVRRLTTPEITRLTRLPDLFNFRELIEKLTEVRVVAEAKQKGNRAQKRKASEQEDGLSPEESEALEAENYRYQAHVAHLAVTRWQPGEPELPQDEFCGECNFTHGQPLWTFQQCLRLMPADVSTVTAAALGTAEVEAIDPFSTETAPSDTPKSATTGA